MKNITIQSSLSERMDYMAVVFGAGLPIKKISNEKEHRGTDRK